MGGVGNALVLLLSPTKRDDSKMHGFHVSMVLYPNRSLVIICVFVCALSFKEARAQQDR